MPGECKWILVTLPETRIHRSVLDALYHVLRFYGDRLRVAVGPCAGSVAVIASAPGGVP